MTNLARLRHPREARFVGMIALTGLLMALYLADGLRLVAPGGSGHRVIDLGALEQRIKAGDLRDREAEWYQPAPEPEPDPESGAP